MLPFYEYRLTDEFDGLQAIALVDRPAIGVNYQAFTPQKFEVVNEDKRIVIGAAMIPNLPIYRRDELGEYYAIFKKETINQLVQKFFKDQKTSSFNEMHDPLKLLEGVYLYQSFITSEDLGILPPKGFEGIADGTWFIAAKVENDEAWKQVKEEGILKGFSVEGTFDIRPYKFNKKNMSKISIDSVIATIKAAFSDIEDVEQAFGEDTLIDGTPVKWEGDLQEGTAIIIVTPEGEVSAPDGMHELTSGTIITTEGGMVVKIESINDEEEFSLEQLDQMLGKALGLWSADLNLEGKFASVSELSTKVTELETKLTSLETFKTELKAEFNSTLQGIAGQLEELAKTETFAATKPEPIAPTTRAQKAAAMGKLIKKNINK